MDITPKFKLLELFCGPGGLASAALKSDVAIGDTRYTIEPVWANDIDRDTCTTYALNIKKAGLEDVLDSVVCGDVRDHVGSFSDIDFNALAFGFPCNDFSMVGESKGFDGKFGPLYSYGVKAISAKNPDWFLAENVGGLRTANEGTAFQTILRDLEQSGTRGYNLTAHLYRFEEYGVPQSRHRIIIVGIRKDLQKVFRVPTPTTPHRLNQVSCKNAIEKPPIQQDALNNDRTTQSGNVVARLMCLPPGENAWFLDKVLALPDEELVETMLSIPTFSEHFPEATTPSEIRLAIGSVRLNVVSARMSQIYRRLDPAKPSYTITGSGGGGTHVYHWEEPRALTNRERARLQTFEDSYEFTGSKESVRKQIGMAVPPKGAVHIFEAILKTMGGLSYESVPANLYENGINLASVKSQK
jgi:DNA (cytosine-5)-methyltransferase 1